MRLLTAVVAITVLVASCEAGSKCMWGPSYWCQSSATAKECGKESYCQQSVWKTEVKVQGTIECDVCKEVVKRLEGLVDNNSTEFDIKLEIEKVCVYMGPLAGECKNIINESFDQIWNLIFNEIDPQEVCKLIDMCKPSAKTQKLVRRVRDTPLCSACKLVADYLKQFVDKNTSEAEIKDDLEKLCNILPGNARNECMSLVAEYFNEIWALVKMEFDSEDICKQLGLCTSSLSKPLKMEKASVEANLCDICKLVANFLKGFVDGNNSEAEAKAALEELCKLLPGNYSTECTALVEKEFDLIWTLLKMEVDSGDICKQIGLCNSTLSTPLKTMVTVRADACDICKLVVSYIKPYVDSNSTEEEVKMALETACSLLPSPYKDDCTKLVEDNFDTIWGLLKNEVDTGEICVQLGLCNSTLSTPLKTKVAVRVNLCDICKLVVSYIKPFVDSNSTEEEVKMALETVCGLLPSPYKDECTKFVDDNFDAIWNLLKNEVDNDEICVQLGLCNSTSCTGHSRVEAVGVADGSEECELCKMIINFLDVAANKNSTQQEVKDALEKFCGIIKSTECTSLVNEYFELVWQLVEGELNNDEFCKQTNLCPSVAVAQVKLPKSSELCSLCKLVVPFLKTFIDSNKTETEAKAAVEELCSKLPALQSECTQLVDDYFPMIWKLLESYVDDEQICQEIGLCSKSIVQSRAPQASVECVLCEFVMKEVDDILKGNTTEAAVEAALDKVCDLLPATIQSECKDLVKEYAPEIIDLLINGLSPQEVCTALKLCTSTRLTSPEASVECVLCEFVLKELDSILNGNTTESAVEAALDKVCDLLPSTIKSLCESLVKEYAPEIISLIVNGLDPSEVCTKLGLCTSTGLTSPEASVECVLCEFVLKEVDSILNGNTTEAAVEAALDKVCDLLPSTIKSLCEDLVKEYAPEIISLIVSGLDPSEVCTKIGLCTSAGLTSPKADVECVICEFAMKELDSLLTQNSTETEIEAALEKVCSLLPKTVQNDCDLFMEQYAPDLLDFLVKELDPEKVCTAIKLCTSSKPRLPTAPKSVKGGPLCIICEYVIKELDSMLDGNRTKAAVESALDKVCSIMPSSIRDDCVKFVDKYTPEIMSLLLNGAAPKALCTLLHLCLFSEQPAKTLLKTPKAVSECDVCKFTFTAVKDLIDSGAAESTVEQALERACTLLPEEITAECAGLVKEYGPQVIQLVDQEIDPDKLCKDLKLCKNSKKATKMLMQPWLKMARTRDL